jgi:hypothetical protein
MVCSLPPCGGGFDRIEGVSIGGLAPSIFFLAVKIIFLTADATLSAEIL